MALNLEELSFQVNTEKLKDAITELGNLRTAVSNLNSTSASAATEQSKLAKSTDKLSDSSEESTKKLSAVEKMLDKTATKMKVLRGQTIELADGVENLGKGFTSSQASQVATARLLGATTDQIKMLTQSFKEYNDMTGVNTFDASANGLSRLNKEIKELTSVSQLAAKGYGLTRDELKLLARDSNALTQAFNQEGRSIEELTTGLNRLEQEFVSASKQRNALIAQSKQVELQVKSEADAIAAAARAQEDSSQSMFRNHQLRLKQEEQTHKAIMSDMAAFYKEQEKLNNVPTHKSTPSQQPMDAAVVQYYKQQTDATDKAAKATAFLEREMLRMDNVLEGFNTNLAISSSNRLLKFREQLALTGVDATTAALKYEDYAERIRKADEHKAKVQKSTREDELKYLARATSVQLGDIGVSLAGGQNPFMVLIQQGDQLRGVLNQVGGDAKEMQQAMSLAFKQIVVGFVDVAKALGSFVVGALLDTSKAFIAVVSEAIFLNKILDATTTKLEAMGFSKTAEFLRDFGAAASGVVATALAGFIVLLGTMAVALKDVIQEESSLSKAMIVTGASFGLSKQAAIDYASSMEAVGVSQSKATAFITELGKQGGFTKQAIDDLTKGAVDLAKYGGVSLEQTAQAAAKFQDKPYEALVKYAEQTGLVTVEQLKFVESLEEQGLTAEATTEAIRIMGQVTQAQADIAKASLSPVEQLWIDITTSIGKAWEAIKELGRSESFINTLRIAFAGLAAVVQSVWVGIKSIATGIGAYSAMFSAAISGDFTAAKNIFAEFSADITKEYKSIGDNFQQNLNGNTSESFKEGLKLTAQQMEKNVVGVKSYAAAQKLLDSVQSNSMKREEAAIKIRNVLTKAGYDELTIQKAIADFNAKHKDKSEKKSQAQKDAEAFEKLQDRLIDRSAGLEKSFSEQVALINKQAKTEEERVFLLEKLVKLQPSYLAGIKAELDTQLKIQKVWDDAVKEQAKIDKANFDALDAIDAKYATQVDAYDLLVLEASLIGKTAEEQKKVLGLKKIELEYEKEIEAIKNKQGIDDSTRKALLDKQLQIRKQAELNLNTEIAKDAAQKLLSEINNIKSGIADAIVTGLFEGGKAGAKKLRDVITSELKRQITLQINANVKTSGTASAIHRAGGIAGNFASNYSTSGFGTALTSGLDEAGQWARDYWVETGNEMFQGIGETLGAWSSNVGEFSGVINDSIGYLSAFNTALDGDYGAAIGEAAGYYFGGPIGAAIGKEIGSWLGLTDNSGTSHMGGLASYSKASGLTTSKINRGDDTYYIGGSSSAAGFSADYSKGTTDVVSAIAKGVTNMLDSTAETFGKQAGYAVSTAFADDTSDDGAWGALVVKLGDSLVTSWENSSVSKWAPKVFADGEAGVKEYQAAIAKDMLSVLKQMDLPEWAASVLDSIGDSPSMEQIEAAMQRIHEIPGAILQSIGTSVSDLSDILVAGMQKSDPEGAGKAFADQITFGIENSLYQGFASQITSIISTQLVTPVIAAMAQGASITEAMSKASIDTMLEQVKAAGTAFAAIVNNPEFKSALAEINTSIAGAISGNISGFSAPVAPDSYTSTAKEKQEKEAKSETDKLAESLGNLTKESKQLEAEYLELTGQTEKAKSITRSLAIDGMSELEVQAYDSNQALKDKIELYKKEKAALESFWSSVENVLPVFFKGDDLRLAKTAFASKRLNESGIGTGDVVADARVLMSLSSKKIKELAGAFILSADNSMQAKEAVMQVVGSLIELADAASSQELSRLSKLSDTLNANAAKAVDKAFAVLEKSISTEIKAYEKSIKAREDQIKSLEEEVNTLDQSKDKLSSLFDLIKNQIDEIYSTVDSTQALQATQAALLIREAINSGVLPSEETLSKAIGSIRTSLDKNLYVTKTEQDKARLSFANELNQLQSIAGDQLSDSEKLVIAANEQIKLLKAANADDVSSIDALNKQLEYWSEQIQIANDTYIAVTDVASAINSLANALGIQANVKATTAGKVINGANADVSYNVTKGTGTAIDYLTGETASIVGTDLIAAAQQHISSGGSAMQLYDVISNSGYSMSQVDSILGLPAGTTAGEVNKLDMPAFANGGMHSGGVRLVGENSPEVEVTGPARYYNASQFYDMMQSGSSSSNAQLIDQLEMMRVELRANVQHTAKLAKQLERLTVPTNDGEALQTKVVV